MAKRKIAVLGGGVGSLSAVYSLTNRPNWAEDYEITVYQLGWRLGGKGANSRNGQMNERIEEHGYHTLFGFYENVFAMMRECYAELGRSEDAPLARLIADTPEDEKRYPNRYALTRNQHLTLMTEFQGKAHPIEFSFPFTPELPGDGNTNTFQEMLEVAWYLLWQFAKDSSIGTVSQDKHNPQNQPSWWNELAGISLPLLALLEAELEKVLGINGGLWAAKLALSILPNSFTEANYAEYRPIINFIVRRVQEHLGNLWKQIGATVEVEWEAYQAWILQDFIGTVICGFFKDELLIKGFDSINHLNFYEWFQQHGTISEGTMVTLRSSLMQFGYDACFAYEKGISDSERSASKPVLGEANMEAGTLLRGGMRLFMNYKGALNWEFQAGCAEVLVAPLYEVLLRRGVKFEFFQKVLRLEIDKDTRRVNQILMERQVDLNVAEYQPLVLVKGIPCWPSEPLYEQIVQGKYLQEQAVNLESHWADWPNPEYIKDYQRTLNIAEDFDDVILGIPVSALDSICKPLKDYDKRWEDMLKYVQSSCTFGFQLWFNLTDSELGLQSDKVIGITGTEPTNLIADHSHVVKREDWPLDKTPKFLFCLGGNMPDAEANGKDFVEAQTKVVLEYAESYVQNYLYGFLPNLGRGENVNWDSLVDLQHPERTGKKRLEAQFFRANIDPSERYILSVVDSTKYRMKAGESGFHNLYLAGDWVLTGLNCGCMEATVMSGMQASRAISGYPEYVPGEVDWDTGNKSNMRFGQQIGGTVADVMGIGLGIAGGTTEAVARALAAMRENVKSSAASDELFISALLKGSIKGGSEFITAIQKTLYQANQELVGLSPKKEAEIDYEKLAKLVAEELKKQDK